MLLVKAESGNGGWKAPPDGWASKCWGCLGSPGKEKPVRRGRAQAGVLGTTSIWGAGGRRETHAEQREDLEQERNTRCSHKVQWAKGRPGGWRHQELERESHWREVLGCSSADSISFKPGGKKT